jgi:alpha-glucuronidase
MERFHIEDREDGYELWLRYRQVDDSERLAQYRKVIGSAVVLGTGATVEIIRHELVRALPALLGSAVPFSEKPVGNALIVGTLDDLKTVGVTIPSAEYRELGAEGFVIRSQSSVIASHPERNEVESKEAAKQSPTPNWGLLASTIAQHAKNALAMTSDNWIVITGNSAPAALTGTFHFLRLVQTHQDIRALDLASSPRIRHRILAHWDNLDGSIERGYAGQSLWNWDELPKKIVSRYHDYARACASIGINGTVLNNVNANAKSLTTEYLEKTAALADVFRPYGIRVYLSPVLSAPIRLGGLATSDPRDPAVAAWWKRKVDEIYRLIPDFGAVYLSRETVL